MQYTKEVGNVDSCRENIRVQDMYNSTACYVILQRNKYNTDSNTTWNSCTTCDCNRWWQVVYQLSSQPFQSFKNENYLNVLIFKHYPFMLQYDFYFIIFFFCSKSMSKCIYMYFCFLPVDFFAFSMSGRPTAKTNDILSQLLMIDWDLFLAANFVDYCKFCISAF